MPEYDLTTPEGRALKRAREITAFFWHLGVFIVVTGFLWLVIQDDTVVFWVTVVWGLAVAFHALAVFLGPLGLEDHIYSERLITEKRREAMLDDDERRKEMVR